jgi:hypothetical protein
VAKQEASGESAAASKESSELRSSASLRRCHRGTGSRKADKEEEVASAPHGPPARSLLLAALLDAVATKLDSVLQRLHKHEGEVGESVHGCAFDCLATCRYFFKNKIVQYPLYTDNLKDLYNYRIGKHYTHFIKISHNKTTPSIWRNTGLGKKLCPVHEIGQIHSYDLLIPIIFSLAKLLWYCGS